MTHHRCPFALLLLMAGADAFAGELIERAEFKEETSQIKMIALHPDGKMLAIHRGENLKLFDPKTGNEIATLPEADTDHSRLDFSPDGKLLAATGRVLQVWDMDSHRRLVNESNEGLGTQTLTFSGDGKRIGVVGWERAGIWDARTGKELRPYSLPRNIYRFRTFSPDLATIAVADFQEIDLLDPATGKIGRTLSEHRGDLRQMKYSQDGKELIAVSVCHRDPSRAWLGDLKIWDTATGKERFSFTGKLGMVTEMAISPAGRVVAVLDVPSHGADSVLRVIDTVGGRDITINCPPRHAFLSVAFVNDNRLYVTGTPDDKTLKLWEVTPPKDEKRSPPTFPK